MTALNNASAPGQLLEKVIVIAVDAGKLILEHQRHPFVATKADSSPVTDADLAAHHHIAQRLRALDPDTPIISEEATAAEYETRKRWRRFWLVDPLDGTKEFVRGSDEYTVNIALIHDQEPVLGVVCIPGKNLGYYAAKGRGSWRQEGSNPPVRIFSSVPDLSRGLTVVESKSHPSEALASYLKDLPVKQPISAGSSLKFCLVAEGAADIYPRLGPTMEWDVAAGDCVYRNSARSGRRASSLTYNKPTLKNDSFVVGFK